MDDATQDIPSMMRSIGAAAREASVALSEAGSERKYAALVSAAEAVLDTRDEITDANALDMEFGREKGLSDAMLDRLNLTEARVRSMANGLRDVAALPDPVGSEMAAWSMPSGLRIRRVRTPLGVVGVIYESRPNVTADAGGLCLQSGNAAILRGGSESFHSSGDLGGIAGRAALRRLAGDSSPACADP